MDISPNDALFGIRERRCCDSFFADLTALFDATNSALMVLTEARSAIVEGWANDANWLAAFRDFKQNLPELAWGLAEEGFVVPPIADEDDDMIEEWGDFLSVIIPFMDPMRVALSEGPHLEKRHYRASNALI